jgi:hypothetical protein
LSIAKIAIIAKIAEIYTLPIWLEESAPFTINCQFWQSWQFLAFLAIRLSLSLFMFRVLADHAHHAFAMHDLALVTNFLY